MYNVQYEYNGKWVFTGREFDNKDEGLVSLGKARFRYPQSLWRLVFLTIEVISE